MAYGNNNFQEKPQFNMAILFLTRLDNRLNERDTAAINGNMLMWYRVLRIIYSNIHFKIVESKDEKDKEINNDVNKQFEKVKNLLKQNAIGNKQLQNQISSMNIGAAEEELEKINIILNDLMYKYHLIFPKKMGQTYEEEIEGDY